jgi:hypothetical protein
MVPESCPCLSLPLLSHLSSSSSFLTFFPFMFWLFLVPALEKALLPQAQVSYQASSCALCLAWTTPYRMFSAALDPDGTVFRLRFTAFVWWVITFPLFGFFFCIIWSLVFHFEYTVATDCGVSSSIRAPGAGAGSEVVAREESASRREVSKRKVTKGWG